MILADRGETTQYSVLILDRTRFPQYIWGCSLAAFTKSRPATIDGTTTLYCTSSLLNSRQRFLDRTLGRILDNGFGPNGSAGRTQLTPTGSEVPVMVLFCIRIYTSTLILYTVLVVELKILLERAILYCMNSESFSKYINVKAKVLPRA